MTDVFAVTSLAQSEAHCSGLFTATELESIKASLRDSVVRAVAEVVPAEMGKLSLNMERALSMLETIQEATATPSLLAQKGEISEQSQKPDRSQESERINNSPPITLEQVSDQLFHEILVAPPSQDLQSGQGGEEADARRSASGRSSKSNRSLATARRLPFTQSSGASRLQDYSEGKVDRVCPRLEEESPEVCDDSGRNSALQPTSSRRVVPYAASQDQLDTIFEVRREQRPKTLRAVDTSLRETIILKACSVASRLQAHHSVTPLSRCILQRGAAFRMGLFLSVLSCAAIDVVMIIENSASINPSREVAALIFAVAAGFISKHLVQGQQHIEDMTRWAETQACSETWRIVSWKKQRWLLAWLALTLLCVLPSGVKIGCQVAKLEPKEDIDIALLSVHEVCIFIIFIVSSWWLFLAALMQCHIISALDVFIDVWSCNLCSHRNFAEGVVSWNTVQALIRRAGISFENIFTIIQTSALLGCVVVAGQALGFALHPELNWHDLYEITCILPLISLSALAGCLLVQSSCITEKCSVLAPLANQVMSDDPMDAGRSYLVCFLTDSAAGIYVKGVRMDMQMAVNIIYFLALAASAIYGLAKGLGQTS